MKVAKNSLTRISLARRRLFPQKMSMAPPRYSENLAAPLVSSLLFAVLVGCSNCIMQTDLFPNRIESNSEPCVERACPSGSRHRNEDRYGRDGVDEGIAVVVGVGRLLRGVPAHSGAVLLRLLIGARTISVLGTR